MENAPQVDVTVEIPRWSFLKQDASGRVDYVSPVPCPFNYGSVDGLTGLDGDPLDAVVLGRRLRRGTRLRIQAVGAVRMTDRGICDDKLICSHKPIGPFRRAQILLFFRFYAKCKGLLNRCRGHSGHNRCLGWLDANEAMVQAEIRADRGATP